MLPSEIGDIAFPPRALEHYAVALDASIDVDAVEERDFKVVIDYGYGATAFVMPNVLSKLGAEVLGVNPYVSTAGVVRFDMGEQSAAVADLVRTSGAQLGAVVAPGGERLAIIDDRGRVLDDTTALLALLELHGELLADRAVALPVSVTAHAERIVGEHGGRVVLTKLGDADLMAAARAADVVFAGDQDGGFVAADFLAAFDASATIVRLLDLLARGDRALSDVADALPTVHLDRQAVVTPWEQKGAVMRSLVEMAGDRPVELIDGVKVAHEDGWALAWPDDSEPTTNVWAEASTASAARNLADEYVRRIRQLVR